MISYELVKQLKDVGFVQKGKGHFEYSSEKIGDYEEWQDTLTYFPELSELIKACEDEFVSVGHSINSLREVGVEWLALSKSLKEIVGNSSEEAVAKLWLALNKK